MNVTNRLRSWLFQQIKHTQYTHYTHRHYTPSSLAPPTPAPPLVRLTLAPCLMKMKVGMQLISYSAARSSSSSTSTFRNTTSACSLAIACPTHAAGGRGQCTGTRRTTQQIQHGPWNVATIWKNLGYDAPFASVAGGTRYNLRCLIIRVVLDS